MQVRHTVLGCAHESKNLAVDRSKSAQLLSAEEMNALTLACAVLRRHVNGCPVGGGWRRQLGVATVASMHATKPLSVPVRAVHAT